MRGLSGDVVGTCQVGSMDSWVNLAEHTSTLVTLQQQSFFNSAGFAGFLAVAAAVIAFYASTRNSRKERWWRRAEYALDRTLSSNEAEQLVGLAMLTTLKSRDKHEQDFIQAAADLFLDPAADGDDVDDELPTPKSSTESER